MSNVIRFFVVSGLPSKSFDSGKIIECIGRQDFIILYDFERSISMLGMFGPSSDEIVRRISNEIPGIGLSEDNCPTLDKACDFSCFSIYRRIERPDGLLLNDIFDVAGSGFAAMLFISASAGEIAKTKDYLESALSSKRVRETESSLKDYLSKRVNASSQRDMYYESEEKLMLNCALESLNNSILSNGLAYKIFFLVPGAIPALRDYIDTHFLVLSEYSIHNSGMPQLIDYLSKRPALTYGADYAKEFVNFYGFHDVNHTLPTSLPVQGDGITIGKFMKDGVLETDIKVRIAPSAINLGFIMTGLPGSGKTREAMSVLDSILADRRMKTAVFIITPTNEWRDFALSHGMFLVRLYEDNVPVNFFRCPETIGREKFYGNLAMILSSAANAGPYRNPMEKCMLNAFRKIYNTTDRPDPVRLYDEIEESIIRYHGRRTGSGVKYTKHGENIKSALENLRGILSRPQYCVVDGIKIEKLAERGAVFDISCASDSTRAQLYALVLNQIYALSSSLDANGDDKLRLVICLEEAQTIFGDEELPAVQDIMQRIQDFRKQGIGLVLLAHNVDDIAIGIRRLCQNKLYLKQAPDMSVVAVKDLIFPNVEQEDAVLKLKTLSSRIGAFSCISRNGSEKRQQDTIFVSTNIYENAMESSVNDVMEDYINRTGIGPPEPIKCRIAFKLGDFKELDAKALGDSYYIKISFLGEELARIPACSIGSHQCDLLNGKDDRIGILNRKGKLLKELLVKASENMYLDIEDAAHAMQN